MQFTIQRRVTQLVPRTPGLRLSDIVVLPDLVALRLVSTVPTACCPTCAQPSTDRHRRDIRTLADLPWGVCSIPVLLTLRQLRCANSTCPRRVCTERLPDLVAAYARQTGRRQALLRAIGLALGGQAGAHLAAQLGLPLSSTLYKMKGGNNG